jgi:CheY-like chemotaxis protein
MALILVVDDEQVIQSMIRETLELGGYREIRLTGSGKEAFQICQESSPDLVITDLVMPDMDGLRLIRSLRQLKPDLRILAISGAAVNKLLEIAKTLGAVGTLEKPFRADDLLASVKMILGKNED